MSAAIRAGRDSGQRAERAREVALIGEASLQGDGGQRRARSNGPRGEFDAKLAHHFPDGPHEVLAKRPRQMNRVHPSVRGELGRGQRLAKTRRDLVAHAAKPRWSLPVRVIATELAA